MLIILERYLEYEKPVLLAKIYLAYLDEKIDWNTFTEFAVIVERIFISDLSLLSEFMKVKGLYKNNVKNIASVLRLMSLGIVELQTGLSGGVFAAGEFDDAKYGREDKSNFDYYITNTGKQLAEIIC